MSKTYFDEAKERWGDTVAWREFEERSVSAEDAADGLMKLFAKLGELKELPPDSNEVYRIGNAGESLTAHFRAQGYHHHL